ncbi:hypothetical protein [Streptomyces sp. NPDC047981]|uniref:hypothetical protein n=1 Tax=Streptomyces sp. NPDC047981 TaxID=3154610 RepID=UPI00343F6E7A
MRLMTLTDGTESLLVDDRPVDDCLFAAPLPYGLTLDDAVAVRAREVEPGDLVVALTFEESGTRQVSHCPGPFPAAPRPPAACPCEGCAECDELDEWTLADHRRVADVAWRYVCLCPSERDEGCVIEPSNRPVIVVRAERVERAKATRKPIRRPFTAAWSVEVEAGSPEEAARLGAERVREQLGAMSTMRWSVSEAGGEPCTVTVPVAPEEVGA